MGASFFWKNETFFSVWQYFVVCMGNGICYYVALERGRARMKSR